VRDDNATICLNPYMLTAREQEFAHRLEDVLSRKICILGGRAAAVSEVNQKDRARRMAQRLGIPVAPGEIVELPMGTDGRPADLGLLEETIRRYLPETGRVIVRGACGSSGSSLFTLQEKDIGSGLDLIRRRVDNSVYLVESLFDLVVSPNIGVFIDPVEGEVSCVSITDQVFDPNTTYVGNTYPSRAKTVHRMVEYSRQFGRHLWDMGLSGYVGFDFCEYEDCSNTPICFFSEVNPRVNGATYAQAMWERVATRSNYSGTYRPEAFAAASALTKARTFEELTAIYGRHFIGRGRSTGLIPYNTGCLYEGRCSFMLLGRSLDHVRNLWRIVREDLSLGQASEERMGLDFWAAEHDQIR